MKVTLASTGKIGLVLLVSICFSCKQKQKGQLHPDMSDSVDVFGVDGVDLNPIFTNELDDPSRDVWQKPDDVFTLLGDVKGKTIADIGAGAGYFTFRLAAKGANVLAIDIDTNFLEYVEKTAIELPVGDFGAIETRIALPESPSLSPEEVDGALIVNTVVFIPERIRYFSELKNGLKESGVLVVVDFKPGISPVAPPGQSWIASGTLEKELSKAGFLVKTIDSSTLPYQYMILAIKK